MDVDAWKEVWQAQTTPAIDSERVLAEIRREQQVFLRTILWRDVREVVVSVVLIPLWVGLGWALSMPWTWYLILPGLLWVAGFLLLDRVLHPQRLPDSGNTILQCAQESLGRIEHQIWLLRNVFWWYLLPLAVPTVAFFGRVAWQARGGWSGALAMNAVAAVVAAVFGWVYRLNQAAVRDKLEPRRKQLQEFIEGLAAGRGGEKREAR